MIDENGWEYVLIYLVIIGTVNVLGVIYLWYMGFDQERQDRKRREADFRRGR